MPKPGVKFVFTSMPDGIAKKKIRAKCHKCLAFQEEIHYLACVNKMHFHTADSLHALQNKSSFLKIYETAYKWGSFYQKPQIAKFCTKSIQNL